jgi:hypothetical protein
MLMERAVVAARQKLVVNAVGPEHVRQDASRRHGVNIRVAEQEDGSGFLSGAAVSEDLLIAEVPVIELENHDGSLEWRYEYAIVLTRESAQSPKMRVNGVVFGFVAGVVTKDGGVACARKCF